MVDSILIIEDDIGIQKVLAQCFEQEGLSYDIASNGKEALQYIRNNKPALVLLDIMLPDMNGFDICEEIRKVTLIPIIFLSCMNSDQDKVLGLSLGGDDYIEKPFRINVLLARVRAHLRRNRIIHQVKNDVNKSCSANLIEIDDISIDLNAREVKRKNKDIHLTLKEFDLLVYLYNNRNQVFSTDHLFETIWGYYTPSEIRTVIVHISSLRKKLEENPLQPKYIITVRGAGYKFVL